MPRICALAERTNAQPHHSSEIRSRARAEESQIEEELFSPTFKKAAEDTEGRRSLLRSDRKHHVVDMVLPELQSAVQQVMPAKIKNAKANAIAAVRDEGRC